MLLCGAPRQQAQGQAGAAAGAADAAARAGGAAALARRVAGMAAPFALALALLLAFGQRAASARSLQQQAPALLSAPDLSAFASAGCANASVLAAWAPFRCGRGWRTRGPRRPASPCAMLRYYQILQALSARVRACVRAPQARVPHHGALRWALRL